MKEDIEKYAELSEVYTSLPLLGHLGLEHVAIGFEVKQRGGRSALETLVAQQVAA